MGEYALLSEVYGWSDNNKTKKTKKVKKKRDTIMPLSPNEMDKELLKDNEKTVFNKQNNPELKLRNMEISPYTDNDTEYESLERGRYSNENIVTIDNQYEPRMNPVRGHLDRFNDPEYEEFLEFKRMKRMNSLTKENQNQDNKTNSIIRNIIDPNDQFNELLLYIFTGIFLLILIDYIYKLGQKSF